MTRSKQEKTTSTKRSSSGNLTDDHRGIDGFQGDSAEEEGITYGNLEAFAHGQIRRLVH